VAGEAAVRAPGEDHGMRAGDGEKLARHAGR
jgi:hypothetical protein